MSFATDISNPQNKKILLVEMDIPLVNDILINYQAGIWFIKFLDEDQDVEDDNGNTGTYPANCALIPDKIDSLLVDSDYYTEVASLALCLTTDSSFYYDEANDELYIHFASFEPPLGKVVRVGVVNGFSMANAEGYYGDTYYDPRVLSVPSLSQRKDPHFFGLMSFQSGEITFINTDGFFDNFHDLNIYGQPVRIKAGIVGYAYADFVQLFEGYIEEYSYNFDEFSIKVQDKRKFLSQKIPVNTLNTTEYPDLSADNVGKYKPIVYGYVRKIPVNCIDGESGGSTYNYLFLDTMYGNASISNPTYLTAYKKGADNEAYETISVNSVDVVSGTFNVASADVLVDGEIIDLWVDCYGYQFVDEPYHYHASIQNIITHLLENHAGISQNSVFYDSGSFSIGTYRHGILIDKQRSLIDIISDLCVSELIYFYVNSDGKFALKKYDKSAAVVSGGTIYDYAYLNNPDISYDTSNYLTSATLAYNKVNVSNTFSRETNTDYHDERFLKYKKEQEKEFQTLLSFKTLDGTTQGFIDDYLDNLLSASDINKVVKRKLDMTYYAIKIMDFISASHHREGDAENYETYELIGRTLNLNDWTLDFEMRKV